MSRRTRFALGLGALLVGINVGLTALDALDGGTPGGPRSSSYATGSDGAAAYAALLRKAGHDVRRLRVGLAEARPEPDHTVVLLDAVGVTSDDADSLEQFVAAGGRLVVGGNPGTWLDRIVPGVAGWSNDGSRVAGTIALVPETQGVTRVEAAGRGAWASGGPALPAVAGKDGALVSVANVADGRVILLADASPLANDRIALLDNAALGLAIAGPGERPVLFAESYHGYGEAAGIGAIPDRWLAAMGIGLAAIVALMLARGTRLGPPEPDARALPPARGNYVDALGALLAKTRDRAAAAEVLRARGLRSETARAAHRGGTPAAELEPLLQPITTDGELVAAGQACARIERSNRRER